MQCSPVWFIGWTAIKGIGGILGFSALGGWIAHVSVDMAQDRQDLEGSTPKRIFPKRAFQKRSYPKRTFPKRTFPKRTYPKWFLKA